jgi:serine/threonine protein kinase
MSIKKSMQTFIGSEAYMAPERLLGNQYSYASDVWSLGVIVAYLTFGYFPFNLQKNSDSGNNMFGLLKIVKEPIEFDPNTSKELVSFVSKCCILDVEKRLTVRELLKDDFITKEHDKELNLKNFIKENYLKKKKDLKEK